MLAFPAGGVLTHDYTDGNVNTANIPITVELVTNNVDFNDAGGQTVNVLNVPPTARLTGSSSITVGNTATVAFSNQFDPSPEDMAAGFHYAYQVYYSGNLIWSQGNTASYASGVSISALTIPAQYLEAPGVTLEASIIDKDGGFTQYSKAITVNNTTLSVATGGNLAVNSGAPFTQSATFSYPDSSGLSPFTAYLYSQGNPTPLAAVSNVQPGVPFNIGYSFASAGSNTLYVTVSNMAGASGSSSNFNVTVQNPVLAVTSFSPLTSGFAVTFNRAVNLSLLNLYDGLIPDTVSPQNPFGINNSLGAADLTLIGQNSGAVRGSLVWNSATNTATFVKTDGVLAPDTYTVTLFSRANGWVDALTGLPLNGTAGDDYTTTFVVAATSAVVLTVPCFARGANQPLNMADNGTAGTSGNPASGLPIHISDGSGVLSVDFQLSYDPALLNIGGVSFVSTLPGSWGVTYNNSVPGTLTVTMSGTTSLPSGGLDLVKIVGTVPASAPYGACEVLSLSNVQINGGQIPGIGSQAIHKAVYLGDADGNQTLDPYDSFDISRVVVGIDSGFYAFPLTDPLIIGDVSGDAALSGLDSSYVLEKSVGMQVPQIPAIPTTPPEYTAGVDPTVAIAAGLLGVRGQTVNSTVAVTDDAGQLDAGLFCINYPTNYVSIDPTLVAASNYLAGLGWELVAYSASLGTLNVGMFSTTGLGLNGGMPQLFSMPFDLLQTAPNGTASITFGPGDSLNGGFGVTMTGVSGSIVTAGYNWIGGTGAAGQANDWSTYGNWDAGLDPNGATTSVVFGNAGAAGTVTLDSGNRTVGAITFNAGTPTTITTTTAAGGTLTLDNGPGDAVVSVSGSGHSIAAPVGVILNSDAAITVNGAADSLAISGNISDGGNGAKGIIKSGAGTLIVSGANTYQGGTVVTGGVLLVASTSALPDDSCLTVEAGGTVVFSGGLSLSEQVAAFATNQTDTAISATATAPTMTTAAPKLAGPPASAVVQSTAMPGGMTTSLTTARSVVSNMGGNPIPGKTKISKQPPAIAPNPSSAGISAEVRNATLQAWTAERSAADLDWLPVACELNDQTLTKIGAAAETIVRYSK